MSKEIGFETESASNKDFIDWKKLNCKKLVYNKRLSGKFKLYLSDKTVYKRAYDILSGKKFVEH